MVLKMTALFFTMALAAIFLSSLGVAGWGLEAARIFVALLFTFTVISLGSRLFYGKSPLETNRMYR